MKFKISVCVILIMTLFVSCNSSKEQLISKKETSNWPMSGGPYGNWRISSDVVVPLHWSVRKNENIKWKKTLDAGGQSGIAVWEDKIFFTTNIPTDNLPFAQIQENYTAAKNNYNALFGSKKKELIDNDDKNFIKINEDFIVAEKAWLSFISSHKMYQKATGGRKKKIRSQLLKTTNIGQNYMTSKDTYEKLYTQAIFSIRRMSSVVQTVKC